MNQEPHSERLPRTARKRDRAKRCSKTAGQFAIQLVFLLGICYVGNAVSATLPISVPGNIVSMTLLLALLISGIVDASRIKLVSDFLLKYMPVFFIPAGVTILSCLPLLQGHIPQFVLVCFITTVMVFLTTSLTVIGVTRLQNMIAAKKRGDEKGSRCEANPESNGDSGPAGENCPQHEAGPERPDDSGRAYESGPDCAPRAKRDEAPGTADPTASIA